MHLLDHELRLGALRIFCDGLCEPNPGGIGTYGFVGYGPTGVEITRGKGVVARGEGATSNTAEYGAAIRALTWVLGEGGRGVGAKLERLEVLSDSQVFVRQLTGEYAVRSPRLRPLHEERRTSSPTRSRWPPTSRR